ncbi:hypothetical protein Agub_g14219 [Astrephomene gubernaculifera]|uniref:Uncharacterized protein n=1 Tax=Astrephomene gubernaculifera TaxID=47775 RepID=A0AAD3E1H8_9CHLO|nr:hypothetical protein Agub_g14219 [Astrephomene gubernaculifera]
MALVLPFLLLSLPILVVPYTPFYRGTKCLSYYTEPQCPVRGVCDPHDHCVLWGTGSFNWEFEDRFHHYDYMNYYAPPTLPPDVIYANRTRYVIHPYAPPNTRMCRDIDVPGFWWGGQWHFGNETSQALDPQCVFQRLKRRDIIECLHGKKVLFMGDSLVRQVFLRLVFYLRGYESVMEHYFHMDAAYTYFNDASDSLLVDKNAISVYGRPLNPNEVFTVGFAWYREPDDYVKVLNTSSPDYAIFGGLFTPTKGDDCGSITRSAVERMVQFGSATGKPSRLLLQMPHTGVHSSALLDGYASRARALVGKLRGANLPTRIDIVPVDVMSVKSTFLRNELEFRSGWPTGLHYQCSFLGEYPVPIHAFKTPPDYDCRDLMNFNTLMLMLNSLCAK